MKPKTAPEPRRPRGAACPRGGRQALADHGWFGPHDLVRVEVVGAAGTDLPEGLRFQIRRPHDGTADLRSPQRREKAAGRQAALPEPTPDMTKAELAALADARGVKVPAKATKKDLLALLAA